MLTDTCFLSLRNVWINNDPLREGVVLNAKGRKVIYNGYQSEWEQIKWRKICDEQNKIKDLFFSFNPGCAEIADEVYMEVIVGEEEATSLPDAQLEDSGVNKTFVPVAWAAAYGRDLYAYFLKILSIIFSLIYLSESLCKCDNLSPSPVGLEIAPSDLEVSVSGVH